MKRERTGSEMEEVARFLIRELRKDFERDKYTCNLYNTDMSCPYDVEMIVFDRATGKKKTTYFIEVKVRNKDYPTIAFEKKKYDGINSEIVKYKNRTSTDIKIEILYVSVHPSGTYVFDIDKLEKNWVKWEGTMRSTMFDNKNQKVDKKLATFLDTKDAVKKFDMKTDELLEAYDNFINPPKKLEKKIKDIFDI